MNLILRSRNALLLLAVAAVLWAVGDAAAGLSWLKLSEFGGPWHYADLYTARYSLLAAAYCLFLTAILAVGWDDIRRPGPEGDTRAELLGAVMASALLVISEVVLAATEPYNFGAHVLGAVGYGMWALLAVGRGVHLNAAGWRGDVEGPHPGTLFFVAGGGLLLNGIAGVFLGIGPSAQTKSLVSGVLGAGGALLVGYAVVFSRSRGWLGRTSSGLVAAGLAVLVGAGVAEAVVSELELGSDGTLGGLRNGFALMFGLSALGVLILGAAAAVRRHQLQVNPSPQTAPPTPSNYF